MVIQSANTISMQVIAKNVILRFLRHKILIYKKTLYFFKLHKQKFQQTETQIQYKNVLCNNSKQMQINSLIDREKNLYNNKTGKVVILPFGH